LCALKTFPVARLKIDRAFVNGLPADKDDMAVATAVISLGQNLNLKVIAEGVETAEQAEFLRQNNCEEVQGYHLSKPIPPGEFETFVRDWALHGGEAQQPQKKRPKHRPARALTGRPKAVRSRCR
jgi:EAL domain-containing protein (putative c-di-GMP-specific phosphodiesterase class I)